LHYTQFHAALQIIHFASGKVAVNSRKKIGRKWQFKYGDDTEGGLRPVVVEKEGEWNLRKMTRVDDLEQNKMIGISRTSRK